MPKDMPMTVIFMLGVLWIAYVYAGYPLLLALVALRKRVRPLIAGRLQPSVSVLIAAHNEAQDIGWKVTETLAWDYPADQLEILVASDASDDATDEIVRSCGDPRVTLIRMERRGGKNRALNRLAELARGEILFFTDANAHIGPPALQLMIRHFADPRVGCVTGDSSAIDDHEAIAGGAGAYWSYESTLKRLENRIGSVLVCDGAIFCMRAALYHRLSPDLANDLELPMRIGAAGQWVIHEPAAIAFERDTAAPRQEFQRRRRMCAQGMRAMLELRGVFSGLRGWQFVSHKLLRWLSLVPMLMMLGASAVLARNSLGFAAALAIQGVFYGLAAAGLARAIAGRPAASPLAVPFYVVLGVVGALVGVGETLLGRRFDVWEIPTLSRGPSSVTFPGAPTGEYREADQ
jgi:cellulose synthase/poly-beta-1,6-N-acetylglucosamine synthase-like glycosyltransferase